MGDPRLTILVLAPNPWDGPRMNRQHLFSRIASRHDVIYSTGVHFFKGLSQYHPFVRVTGRVERRDGLLVDHAPSWLVRNLRVRAVDDLAARLAARRWRRATTRRSIAYLFHPSFWPHVRFLSPTHVVYHAYDLFDRQQSWCEPFAAWERELLARADLVVASSSVIRDRLLGLGAREVMLLENGGDYDLFAAGASQKEPDDLASIPRPRVGYSGAINQKVDLPLVASLARRRPDLQFVLIGLVAHLGVEMERALADLRPLPNVHLLGRKTYTEMPAYVAHMDVNTIWNRVGEGLWTEGTFPLKLHEYLAAGPPVVVSDLPALRQFSDVLRIARNPEEWESALKETLSERGAAALEARRRIARENTWDARASQLEKALTGLIRTQAGSCPADPA